MSRVWRPGLRAGLTTYHMTGKFDEGSRVEGSWVNFVFVSSNCNECHGRKAANWTAGRRTTDNRWQRAEKAADMLTVRQLLSTLKGASKSHYALSDDGKTAATISFQLPDFFFFLIGDHSSHFAFHIATACFISVRFLFSQESFKFHNNCCEGIICNPAHMLFSSLVSSPGSALLPLQGAHSAAKWNHAAISIFDIWSKKKKDFFWTGRFLSNFYKIHKLISRSHLCSVVAFLLLCFCFDWTDSGPPY